MRPEHVVAAPINTQTASPSASPTGITASLPSSANATPVGLIVIISVFAFLILLGVGGILMWRTKRSPPSSKSAESLLPSVSSNANLTPSSPLHNTPAIFNRASMPRSLAETNHRRAKSIKIHQYSAADGISNRTIQDTLPLLPDQNDSGKNLQMDRELNTLDERLFTLARGLSKLDKGLSQLDDNLDKLDKGLGTLERYSVSNSDGVIKANGVPLCSSLPRSEKSWEKEENSSLGMAVVAVFSEKKSLSLGRTGETMKCNLERNITERSTIEKDQSNWSVVSQTTEISRTTIKRKQIPLKNVDAEIIPLRRVSLEEKTANIESKTAHLQQKAISLDRKALSLNKKAEKMDPITSGVLDTNAVIGDVSNVGWLAVEDATEIAKAFRSRLINPPDGWDDSISESSNN
ncbi:hypothetical protein HDV01_004084 [Terramyces sp. JEL0728]|nr:hypothetical protein HDV01_004084 [Terramyces sp. JEL0728]